MASKMSGMAKARPARRTQQQRREATRNALMDATVECLVERGYAGTTTRAVSERAGVTPGALQHHFASKEELVAEAIGHLAGKLTAQLVEEGVPSAPSRRRVTERLVDYLWETLNGPLVAAVTELAVAGRTDASLRERLAPVQRQALEGVPLAARALFPEQAASPGFIGLVDTVLAAIRGVVLLGFLSSSDREDAWRSVRPHLLAMIEGWQA
jgi:AcrR family transcriptional regulator